MKRFLSVLLGVFLSVFWCTYLSNSSTSALQVPANYYISNTSASAPYYQIRYGMSGDVWVGCTNQPTSLTAYADGSNAWLTLDIWQGGCNQYFNIPQGSIIELQLRVKNIIFFETDYVSNSDRFAGVTFDPITPLDREVIQTLYFYASQGTSQGFIRTELNYYIYQSNQDPTIDVLGWVIYSPSSSPNYTGSLNNINSSLNSVNGNLQGLITGVGGVQSSVDNLVNISNQNSQAQIDAINNQTQAIDNLESSITDSDTSSVTDSADSFFSGFTTDTFGLTSVITAPLTLIQNITSSSCSDVSVPLPFVDESLSLPCLRDIYEENFGGFYQMYQVITFGIIAYWVCVRIFNLVKDFKNPEHDEVEVLDL